MELLAAEVDRMAKETKTEAIRRALLERKARLAIRPQSESRKKRLLKLLEGRIWPGFQPTFWGERLQRLKKKRFWASVRKAFNGMILDSSAIVAVMLAEPGYQAILERMGGAELLAAGAPTVVETAIVLSARWGRDARPELDAFLREADVEVIPFTADHYRAGVDAFLRYGKGRHPAALNFGDCLSYAVASLAGMPLLFVGANFSRTDLGEG